MMQTSVVQFLADVPDLVFENALLECKDVNWKQLPYPDSRSQHPHFRTSAALHLRTHKIEKDTVLTIACLSEIIECVDSPVCSGLPRINRLVDWICQELEVTRLGRVMLVRLESGGKVPVHIDVGSYFESYYRFHIPIQTTSDVYFLSQDPQTQEVMRVQKLYQLRNRLPHGVINGSQCGRVHLIVDAYSDRSELKYSAEKR